MLLPQAVCPPPSTPVSCRVGLSSSRHITTHTHIQTPPPPPLDPTHHTQLKQRRLASVEGELYAVIVHQVIIGATNSPTHTTPRAPITTETPPGGEGRDP